MDIQVEPLVIQPIEGGCRIKITGSVHINADWLENDLKRITETKPTRVEMDLSGTQYISTVGVACLVGFRNGIVKHGGTVHIIAIDDKVLSVLSHAHLGPLFHINAETVVTHDPKLK